MPIPSSGLFKIFPSTFVNIVSGEYDVQAGSLPVTQQALASRETIAAYYSSEVDDGATCPKLRRVELNSFASHYTPAVGVYETQCFLKHRVIFDSGGVPTPIDFISAEFPLGCRFTQPAIVIDGPASPSWQDNRRVSNAKLKARLLVIEERNYPTLAIPWQSGSTSILPFSMYWGANQIFGTTIGHQFTVINVPGGTGVSLYQAFEQFYLTGSYQTGWISLSVNPISANPGDTIVISDSLSNFEIFTDFKAYWKASPTATEYSGGIIIPRSYWTKTNTQITLKLPLDIGIPFGNRKFSIFGVITFGSYPIPSGGVNNEILLARLNDTSILTNGSGIYNLQTGKRDDTYYDRSVSPTKLTNLKIPNPLIRSGFF